jgi:hypothetical protein
MIEFAVGNAAADVAGDFARGRRFSWEDGRLLRKAS